MYCILKFTFYCIVICNILINCTLLSASQKWGGALTLNYRAIGQQPKEVEIEHQMLISDFFLNFTDTSIQDLPFFIEFSTDLEGKPQLYRVNLQYLQWRETHLTIGKFMIPFGLYNKLYRPDLYYSLTKPLLYATPGLDYVSGVNFPHPLFSCGYADTGFMVQFNGKNIYNNAFMPSHFSLYMVNGFQERGRDPLEPYSFIIFSPVEGVDLDWGHERNFLADNNDTKSIGGRLEYDFGDLSLLVPSYPIPKKVNLNGFLFGISGHGGKYDIEDTLSYRIYGCDVAFQSGEFSISSEYGYSGTDFRSRDYALYIISPDTISLLKDKYYTHGGYIQVVFPFAEFPLTKRTNLIGRVDNITRKGPALIVVPVQDADVGYINPGAPKMRSRIYKYTGAFNSWMSKHLSLKLEYSYWDFKEAEDIYQMGVGCVLSF